MARRDIIIPPFYAPGGLETVPTQIHFLLVGPDKTPLPGMPVGDDESIVSELVVTTTDVDVTISLTPQDELYGETYWRIRIPTPESAVRAYCKYKYEEYFVQMPSGAPITLRELLNQTGTPGQPSDWDTHLTDPTFSQLHNPSDATDQQIPIWDDAQQKWVAADQAAQGPPLAHAASHATGGTDELTPAAIGAVEESGESLVQGLSIAVVDAVPGVQTAGVIYFVRSAP